MKTWLRIKAENPFLISQKKNPPNITFIKNWTNRESDIVWYCNDPLDTNTLRSLMKIISVEYKLSKEYTKHYKRYTAVSVLDNDNFEPRHIMRVSGHKPETRFTSYPRQLTESKQREISHTLASVCTQITTEIGPVSTETVLPRHLVLPVTPPPLRI